MDAPEPGQPAAPRTWILHVDLDQFVAAVEILRRPELRGRPVVVGGDGNPHRPRQVVATASYEARAFGVGSGMGLREALRRCPDAVFLPTDPTAYDAASATVMGALRALPVVLEVQGWDEAFLATRTDDPGTVAVHVRSTVFQSSGLSCTVGIGDTKQRAKLAATFAKAHAPGRAPDDPAGIGRLDESTWLPVMGDRPTDALWGIGSRWAVRLAALGYRTVAELAAADPDDLAAALGPRTGPGMVALARGGGYGPVSDAPWVAKSRSRETTYELDVTDPADVRARVAGLARGVTAEVVAEGRVVSRVEVKVRSSAFLTRNRISKLAEPTSDPEVVAAAALRVLERLPLDRPTRLLGVRVELLPPGAAGPAALNR